MSFWGTFTGATVQNKVNEYTEVYGEVLLGLHRDLQRQQDVLQEHQRRLDAYNQRIQKLEATSADALASQVGELGKLLNQSHTQFATQQRQIEQLRLRCVLSYVFAVLVGVVVWLLK
jgi:exonuclease VII large subunit